MTGNTLYSTSPGVAYASGMVSNEGSLNGHVWANNTFYGNAAALQWLYNHGTPTNFTGWKALTGFTNPATHGGSLPPNKIVVRPNQYEAGRANIIVYNWALHSTVSVDVSGVLSVGEPYAVQNVQDFYGTPVASGTYDGSPLQLPMIGIAPPAPIGRRATPAPVTGPAFNVFVLLKTSGDGI